MEIYENWINLNYPGRESTFSQCNVAVYEMVRHFPELKVQTGWANGIFHCWCKDEAGNIVDPTAEQFDGEIKYQLIAERFLDREEVEEPTGIVFLENGEVHVRSRHR